MRRTYTIGMILLGIVLMLVGYLTAAPWGAESVGDSNPGFDFAPTVFVLGVITAFASALVYELMSDRRE